MATFIVFIFLFFAVLIAALHVEARTKRKKQIEAAYDFTPVNVHGSARFATNDDLQEAGLFKGKGVPIGYSTDGKHALHYGGKLHLLSIASSRSGKGILLINALLSWRGSCICVDVKGENAAVTANRRRAFGKVFIINPFNLLPDALKDFPNCRINPMDILEVKSSAFHAQCDKLAMGIVPDEPNALHFSTRARTLVSGVIAALKRHGKPGEQNLPTVARVINGDIVGFCRLTVQQTTDRFIIDKLASFADAAPDNREVQDVISTARGRLAWLANAAIADSLSGSDVRFSDLRRRPGTIYIILPLEMLDVCAQYFRELLETAFADLLHEGRKGKGRRVLCLLDEMAMLGPHMKSLENAMGMAAGAMGLQLWCVLQDLSQLRGMFPHTFETFIQNCGVACWWGLRDQTSREYVSRLAGTCEVLTRSRGVSFDNQGFPHVSDNASQHSRPLLLPHEVGQLADDEMIAFVEGVRCGPVKAKRKPYWKVFPPYAYRRNPYAGKKNGLWEWLFG